VTDVLSDTIPGIRVVKAFNQEDREIGRFGERNEDVTAEFNRIHRSWTTFWPLLILGVHAMTVTVWMFAVPRLLGTGVALPVGTFVSFLLYTTMFLAPIDVIGQMARTINRATTSAHRVFEVLDTEPEIRDAAEPVRLEPVHGRVTFEHVTFGYDGVRQVLRGVSFDVAPGELIGLVGPSGGGKTTIVNLIARFYDVSGGAIRIDGVDLRRLDTGHYRRQIGMVLQDPYLFHGTVLENIRYGLPEAPLSQVVTAAQAANAHDFITKLQHGYDTVVGERGHTLSGGGKTTIVNLIARFYDVTGGAIRVDGVDIRRLDTGHYRRQIGMVLQDPYLFHGTILENIRYGLPDASLGQVVAAAQAANAHDFITKLQHGYDTVVGERGHTLSGGERQRVSIARAILHDPRILILDEATSSVDTETEREIQQALERLVSGRTVFAIAHRLSTLRKASRLFVIEDGRLVEHGTHGELLAKPDGKYRRLYELQLQLQ